MSSYNKKTHIVFLDLPDQISQKIDLMREKYSNSGLSYKAHLTLKQDEDFLISDKKIVEIVSDVLSNQESIRLTISQASYNENKTGWNIFLPVRSKIIVKLVSDLSKALEPYIDPDSPRSFLSTKWEQSDKFYPHISIKGTAKKSDFKKIFREIKKSRFNLGYPVKVTCSQVTIAKWNRDKWEKIITITLKNVK